jgi:hypothetical protein
MTCLRGLTGPTLAAAVLIAGCGGGTAPQFEPGRPAPRAAKSLTKHLIAGTGELSRGALTRAAATIVPHGAALPAGSHLRLDSQTWRQTGRFANSAAVLMMPHKPAQHVEVGFMHTRSGWRVTFVEDVS